MPDPFLFLPYHGDKKDLIPGHQTQLPKHNENLLQITVKQCINVLHIDDLSTILKLVNSEDFLLLSDIQMTDFVKYLWKFTSAILASSVQSSLL